MKLWFWPKENCDDSTELMYSHKVGNFWVYYFRDEPYVQQQSPTDLGWVYIGEF